MLGAKALLEGAFAAVVRSDREPRRRPYDGGRRPRCRRALLANEERALSAHTTSLQQGTTMRDESSQACIADRQNPQSPWPADAHFWARQARWLSKGMAWPLTEQRYRARIPR